MTELDFDTPTASEPRSESTTDGLEGAESDADGIVDESGRTVDGTGETDGNDIGAITGDDTGKAESDGSTGAPSRDEEQLDLDDVFHVLQNERRRRVLQYLEDTDGTVEMRDIAEQIAAWENDTTVENLYSDQRQRVYIALYQSHLPKLDDLGVIEYNQSRGYVESTPLVSEINRYVDPDSSTSDDSGGDDDRTTNWIPSYLAATGISSILIGAGWAGLLPLAVSGIGVATVVLALFATIPLSLAV